MGQIDPVLPQLATLSIVVRAYSIPFLGVSRLCWLLPVLATWEASRVSTRDPVRGAEGRGRRVRGVEEKARWRGRAGARRPTWLGQTRVSGGCGWYVPSRARDMTGEGRMRGAVKMQRCHRLFSSSQIVNCSASPSRPSRSRPCQAQQHQHSLPLLRPTLPPSQHPPRHPSRPSSLSKTTTSSKSSPPKVPLFDSPAPPRSSH